MCYMQTVYRNEELQIIDIKYIGTWTPVALLWQITREGKTTQFNEGKEKETHLVRVVAILFKLETQRGGMAQKVYFRKQDNIMMTLFSSDSSFVLAERTETWLLRSTSSVCFYYFIRIE